MSEYCRVEKEEFDDEDFLSWRGDRYHIVPDGARGDEAFVAHRLGDAAVFHNVQAIRGASGWYFVTGRTPEDEDQPPVFAQ